MQIDQARLRKIESRAEAARAAYLAASDRENEKAFERNDLVASMRSRAAAEGIEYETGRRRFRQPMPTLPAGIHQADPEALASVLNQVGGRDEGDLLAAGRAQLKALDQELTDLRNERARAGQVQEVTLQLAARCREYATAQGGTTHTRRPLGA